MKLDRINYQKTFNLGNYSSERIGVEIQVDETDDWEETFALAKRIVENTHKDNNPGLYLQVNPEWNAPPQAAIINGAPVFQEQSIQKQSEPQIGLTVSSIESVTDIKVLMFLVQLRKLFLFSLQWLVGFLLRGELLLFLPIAFGNLLQYHLLQCPNVPSGSRIVLVLLP